MTFSFGGVERGDVVVFGHDNGRPLQRVVAVGGETISFEDNVVHIDGEPLAEPYLAPGTETSVLGDTASFVVPEGHLFVMGDNRANSLDSRSFGTITEDSVISNRLWIVSTAE